MSSVRPASRTRGTFPALPRPTCPSRRDVSIARRGRIAGGHPAARPARAPAAGRRRARTCRAHRLARASRRAAVGPRSGRAARPSRPPPPGTQASQTASRSSSAFAGTSRTRSLVFGSIVTDYSSCRRIIRWGRSSYTPGRSARPQGHGSASLTSCSAGMCELELCRGTGAPSSGSRARDPAGRRGLRRELGAAREVDRPVFGAVPRQHLVQQRTRRTGRPPHVRRRCTGPAPGRERPRSIRSGAVTLRDPAGRSRRGAPGPSGIGRCRPARRCPNARALMRSSLSPNASQRRARPASSRAASPCCPASTSSTTSNAHAAQYEGDWRQPQTIVPHREHVSATGR